jgi:hypothetical protein
MGARFFGADAAGVSRLTRRFLAVDSLGVTRLIKRAFVCDGGGVGRLFFVGNMTFTLTAGENSQLGYSGYIGSGYGLPFMGSIDTPAVPLGGVIAYMFFNTSDGFSHFGIGGLSADPGASYWTTLLVNGSTVTSASASAYQFANGVAAWVWNRSTTGVVLGFTNGSHYLVTLNFG